MDNSKLKQTQNGHAGEDSKQCVVIPQLRDLARRIDPIKCGYTQWSIDWLETFTMDESELDDRTLLGSLHYELENILEIMRPELKDYEFFRAMEVIIRVVEG